MNAIAASIDRSASLRRVLFVDAATCAAMGVLLTFDAAALSSLLQLPVALIEYAGLSLFPVAAYIAWVATRAHIARRSVWALIAGNILWIAGSALMLVSGWVSPSALGYTFVIMQALAVVLFVELEYVGLRRI